jgi:HK97 gp10 family phage protein
VNRVVTVKVEGVTDLQARLDRLPREIVRRILRRALAAGAEVWKREMELRVARLTGFLAQHIGVKITVRGDQLAGTAAVGPLKQNYPERIPKTHGRGSTISAASVARFLEFGTRKMRALPFIRQAFEARKDEALAQFIREAKAGLDESVH